MKFARALITGASSGIGEALARLLSSKGIPLIITGRNRERLERIAQEVHAEENFALDLADREERKKLVTLIRERQPDLVINNAGFGVYGDALTISVEQQLSILEVNGAAALELTLESARTLISAQKKGVILNVSSVAGEYPCPGMAVYGATKAFLTNISRALNTELAPKGVNILVSCPGMVATDFANRAAKSKIKNADGPVLTPQFAAQQIWRQIEKGEEKRIFNWQYRLLSLLTICLPVSLIKKTVWKRIKQRIQ